MSNQLPNNRTSSAQSRALGRKVNDEFYGSCLPEDITARCIDAVTKAPGEIKPVSIRPSRSIYCGYRRIRFRQMDQNYTTRPFIVQFPMTTTRQIEAKSRPK